MTDAALYCLVIGVLYGRLASALVYRRRLRRANENGSRWLNRAVVAEGQNVALREREQRRDLRDTAALHRAFPMNATPSVPARFRGERRGRRAHSGLGVQTTDHVGASLVSATSSIQWTDATWNPIRGCSRVSAGCQHCYAETVAARFSGPGLPYEGLARRRSNGEAQWTGEVRVIEKHMLDPLRWQKPRRIFVNSMSDLFHEKVSDETLDTLFAIMALANQHVFQCLTKRPERMLRYMTAPSRKQAIAARAMDVSDRLAIEAKSHRARITLEHFSSVFAGWGPFPNVWLGVSVEHQAAADERIPLLLHTPAAVRFLSCEPLLEAVDLNGGDAYPQTGFLLGWHAEQVHVCGGDEQRCDRECPGVEQVENPSKLDWVIVGGESGAGARPFDIAWARALVAQCRAAGVAVFVKQLGAQPVNGVHATDCGHTICADQPNRLSLRDSHGGDMAEWPEDLRVREFPVAAVAIGGQE